MADSKPYGNVAYADPGYQSDKQARYPIDTAEHVKAAWAYINKAHNASMYSADQLAEIKGRIKSAAAKFGIQIEESEQQQKSQPPRENLVRVMPASFELRAADGSGMPVMVGHFAPLNTWTHINSSWEGEFMERVAPGAATKTFQENRANMRVLFNHGQDPSIGEKPLGIPSDLREDENGHYFEVPLFDTSYNRDLLPGLQAGAYGTSWRMAVVKDNFNRRAQPSEYNPDGLPERTILEMRVAEFGPVTFPAYPSATVGVRSMTDDYIMRRLGSDPERLRSLLSELHSSPEPAKTTPVSGAAAKTVVVQPPAKVQDQEWYTWLSKTSTNSDQ